MSKDKQAMERRVQEGMQHLTFVCKQYRDAMAQGRFFLHEHPSSASSWDAQQIKELRESEGVIYVECDQCQYGLTWDDGNGHGERPVRKRTGWLTNSPCVAAQLRKRCPGDHQHANTIGLSNKGRRHIERYPAKLVSAILRGLRAEAVSAGWIGSLEAGPHIDEPEPWDCHPEYYQQISDNISGVPLDPELVAAARKEELDFVVTELGAYRYTTVEECRRETGKPPVPMVWVDVNKGDDRQPKVRSRLCVAETRHRASMDLGDPSQTFSATPPYEALRLMVSLCASPRTPEEQEHTLMFLDITRAHPHCEMKRSCS